MTKKIDYGEAACYGVMWGFYGIVSAGMIIPPFIMAFIQDARRGHIVRVYLTRE